MFGFRIQIFRLFGIPIRIDLSWIVIALLVVYSLARHFFAEKYGVDSFFSLWSLALTGTVALFASIVLHELAHALVARRFQVGIRGITLFIFGGVAEMERPPASPRAEFFIAIAGPIMSFALAVATLTPFALLHLSGFTGPASGLFGIVGLANGMLAVFNLAPALPLDGGRVLRAILWSIRGDLLFATRATAFLGRLFAVFLFGIGVLQLIVGATFAGLWSVMLGLFIHVAARAAYRQTLLQESLTGQRVADFLSPGVVAVPADITLEEFVERFIYKARQSAFPVVSDQELVGVLATDGLKSIPRAEWGVRTAGEAAESISEANTLAPNTDAYEALLAMSRFGRPRMLVVENGELIGMVSASDLTALLALKLDLGEGLR